MHLCYYEFRKISVSTLAVSCFVLLVFLFFFFFFFFFPHKLAAVS